MPAESQPHLLQPEQSVLVQTDSPYLYVDNYMVGGYTGEHQRLGGRRNVQLNMGIEGVKEGAVLVDRPIHQHYLDYLAGLGLFSPSDVRLIQVEGSEATMLLRLLALPARIDAVRRKMQGLDLQYIDTFGISERLGPIDTKQSHRRTAEALDLPMFYNSTVADRLWRKSACRKTVQGWLTGENPKELFSIPPGLEDLSLDALSAKEVRRHFEHSSCTHVAIKKDIATYNLGNAFLERNALLAHCTDDHALRDFLKSQCPFLDGDTFCIEECVTYDHTPSAVVQVLPDGTVTVKSMQEQVYVGDNLENFRYPTNLSSEENARLHRICMFIGSQLHKEDYIGHAVPDFAVDSATGSFHLMEINMRRGGSTVGQRVAERLSEGPLDGGISYITAPYRARPDVEFREVEQRVRELQYDVRKGSGLILAEAGRFEYAGILTLVAMTRGRVPGALPEDLLARAKDLLHPLEMPKKS